MRCNIDTSVFVWTRRMTLRMQEQQYASAQVVQSHISYALINVSFTAQELGMCTHPSLSSQRSCSEPAFSRLDNPPLFSLCRNREMRIPAPTPFAAVRPQ
jgi:hypothetical protein